MIIQVNDELMANECDKLLTKLIKDEKKYNNLIDNTFVVNNYFKYVITNENNILLCYIDNKNIVGYTYFKYVKNSDGVGYLIDGLFVEEDYRNRGIAKSLINYGFELLKEKDYDYIDINVMYQNKAAINLYSSLGFKNFSLKMRKE